MRTFDFGTHRTGEGLPCFIIAEVGHNHQGSIELAKLMIKTARDSGADAVKLQKRDLARLMTPDFAASPYPGEHSFGATYGEHRAALELDADAWHALFAYAAEVGVTMFASAFDADSVDFLAGLGAPVVKISSGDALNWPLLDYAAARQLPLIVSTGGLDWQLVDETVAHLHRRGAEFALLQCTSSYPCPPGDLELRVVAAMRARYPDVVIGYSGHEDGIAPSLAAVALGAAIVERHFTTDRALRGSDHRYSLDGAAMAQLSAGVRTVEAALGTGTKRRLASEEPALHKLSKKLVAARPLPAGHVLAAGDLQSRSPGDGISPHRLDELTGRQLRTALAASAALTWEALR